MINVYDCFIFNGEDLVYDRIELLSDVIHMFYIVEGSHTFQGTAKPPLFDINRVATHIQPKINLNIADLSQAVSSPDVWAAETAQRNALMGVLELARDDDLILISDVDEIPRPSLLKNPAAVPAAIISMWSCYFYIDYVCEPHITWNKAVILSKAYLRKLGPDASFEQIRCGLHDRKLGRINRGGWHFSYLGGVDKIYEKLSVFSHTELKSYSSVPREEYLRKIRLGKDIFDRGYTWARFKTLPKEYDELTVSNRALFARAPTDTVTVRSKYLLWGKLRNGFKKLQADMRHNAFKRSTATKG